MNRHENCRLHCRLKEIMREKGMSVAELHRISGVSRETICILRNNGPTGVSTRSVARVCAALGVGIGDLFELLVEDIWRPIRLTKEVTIHFGSRVLHEPKPARRGDVDTIISRQYLGSWDFRAFQRVSEYLLNLKLDIRISFKEHITGAGRGFDPAVRASAKELFAGGNHIVIGSPIANQFTEEVVCHSYGVAPYNPQMRSAFPYGFVWDDWRNVRSSFGWQGQGKQFGVAALPSNKIVAPHVIVPSGEGVDAGLILVHRLYQAPSRREAGDDDERIVICFLGYSGPGTLGAAQVATNPEFATGLFPSDRKGPRMRAVACKYFRHESALPDDNREVTEATLVPDHLQPVARSSRARTASRRKAR